MERKIGEIFNIDNDWYQVVKSNGECCKGCAFYEKGCKAKYADVGSCGTSREDWTQVIFKKLEKVGEPYVAYGKVRQQYKLHAPLTITNGIIDKDMSCDDVNLIVDIELKQNKEDMEENKTTLPKEDNALTRTVYAYVNGKISDKELIRSIKEMSDEYPYIKNNLKPFSLELAKQGKSVCTRDGKKARILCYDLKGAEYPIVAAVETRDRFAESIFGYDKNGRFDHDTENNNDLMMLPEKKEGWVNVYKDSVYDTKDQALIGRSIRGYIDTIKVSWEE